MSTSEVPYLYMHSSRASANDPLYNFNPKAVTQASQARAATRTSQRPQSTGPLLNFNRHPDSYIQAPYGQTNVQPMSPKTKSRVKYTRWGQLFLRCVQMIGAVALLFFVIVIRGPPAATSWILRVPPAADLIIGSYGIYHLCRAARKRTPTSAASYHFFSLVLDLGLVAFFVFAALLSRTNFLDNPSQDGRWRTTFASPQTTTLILGATWLTAVTMAGLHFTSFVFDIVLTALFRRIAAMPPDMNPLEDKVSTAPASKHKYKTSEVSVSEKRLTGKTDSMASFASLSADDRLTPDGATIPFFHTRNDSRSSFSPHNPRTKEMAARASWHEKDDASAMQNSFHGGTLKNSPSLHATEQPAPFDFPSPQSASRGSTSNSPYFANAAFSTSNIELSQPLLESPRSSHINDSRRKSQLLEDVPLGSPRSSRGAHNVNRKSQLMTDNWFVQNDSGVKRDSMFGESIPPKSTSHSRYSYQERERAAARINQPGAGSRASYVADAVQTRSSPMKQYLSPHTTDRNTKKTRLSVPERSNSDVSSIYSRSSGGSTPKVKQYGELSLQSPKRGQEQNNLAVNGGQTERNMPLQREGNARVISRSGVDLESSKMLGADATSNASDSSTGWSQWTRKRQISGAV